MANITVTDASRSTVPDWSLSIADFGSPCWPREYFLHKRHPSSPPDFEIRS
jgi:hypothetical protein